MRLRGYGPEIVGKELQYLLEALRLAEELRRVDAREDAQREDVLQPLEPKQLKTKNSHVMPVIIAWNRIRTTHHLSDGMSVPPSVQLTNLG